MSDEPRANVLVGWMKLFHPAGVLCSLPIDGDGAAEFDYSKAFRSVQAAVLAGFTVNAPGLEAGEKREVVGYVLRREKENKDGSQTPIIDLYSPHDAVQYKFLSVYLNKEEDVVAFELASGLHLADIKGFPGTAAPQRGANKQSDKFITRVKPFHVVLIDNPKYDEKEAEEHAARKETYKVPKRVFVRWDGQHAEPEAELVKRPDPNSPEANGANKDKPKDVTPGKLAIDEAAIGEWSQFLRGEPSVESLNKKLPKLSELAERTRRRVWCAVKEYAEDAERAWEFDGNRKVFVAPVDADEMEVGKAIPF